MLYNVSKKTVDSTFHYYILPQANPKLTPFCTELTGITQDMVTLPPLGGRSFVEVFKLHRQWLIDNGLINEQNEKLVSFTYLTCGDWDLKTALTINANHFKVSIPQYMKHWINIKSTYQKYTNQNARGMAGMLSSLGLTLKGKHHSGIDDCLNICQIVENLQSKYGIVWKNPSYDNPNVEFRAGDWNCEQCNDHNYARNTKCRQCGNPNPNPNAGQQRQYNRNNNNKNSNIFRDGDWNCPSCNDHNYARNLKCRRCNTDNPNPENASNYGKVAKRDGDWNCASCGFHNFSRNSSCKQCSASKV